MPRCSLVPRLFLVEEMWLATRLAPTSSEKRPYFGLTSMIFFVLWNRQFLWFCLSPWKPPETVCVFEGNRHHQTPHRAWGDMQSCDHHKKCHNHVSTTSAITCKRLAEVPQNQRLGTETGHSHNVQENWGRSGLLLNPKRMGKGGRGGMRDCKNLNTCYS